MKKATYAIPVVLTIIALLYASAPPNAWAARDKIINSFPAPTTAPVGLTYGGGELFLGDFTIAQTGRYV